ncbi:MAG: MerR family transcriptional regulator [Clostridiaceae bacterium]|nr:MerR family transcriptional regulator [Clostridiaceae bacterium]
MEYTINKLAKMAGISTRTLRYYDQCGILSPARVSSNGYRIYGQKEIDRLQQVLFYRELDVPLEEIKSILSKPDFDGKAALENHLTALIAKRGQIDALIANVEKTLRSLKGEIDMADNEKFAGFKENLIAENEEKYGAEIREKYGSEVVERSNAKLRDMTQEQYADAERLAKAYQETLKEAFKQGDPTSELAQKACDLHRQWLCHYYDGYCKEYHMGLAEMYVNDPRFTEYYDKIAPGCAVFLRDAIMIYCMR